jgi:hypothetical protein
MTITGVTVSLKVNDTDYGRGSERFISLRGDTPEGEGIDLQNFDEILDRVMELNLQAWEGVQASRFTGGVIKADELKDLILQGRRRTDRVLQFLKQRGTDATNSESTES